MFLRIDVTERLALNSLRSSSTMASTSPMHQIDRNRIRRFTDARGLIAFRRTSCDTNNLPRRRDTVHQDDQAKTDYVVLARRRGAEMLR